MIEDNLNNGRLEEAKAQYLRLEQQAKKSVEEGRAEQIALTLRVLQLEFLQLEGMIEAMAKGKTFEPDFLASILRQFLEKLDEAGIHHIGSIGERVAFDSEKHLPLPSAGIISPGTIVEIVNTGYSFTDHHGVEKTSLPARVRPVI